MLTRYPILYAGLRTPVCFVLTIDDLSFHANLVYRDRARSLTAVRFDATVARSNPI